MSEKIEKLARMANQIADYFRLYPEERAVAGVKEHIEAFWTRRMRAELSAYAASGGQGLSPLVMKAISGRTDAEAPTAKVLEGPGALGQMESDAG
jgi:formate dehydrogenase subunit delta